MFFCILEESKNEYKYYFGEANVGILTCWPELIIEFCKKENQVILARFDLKIRTNHNLLEDEFQLGLF
jgi:hypothetical protein